MPRWKCCYEYCSGKDSARLCRYAAPARCWLSRQCWSKQQELCMTELCKSHDGCVIQPRTPCPCELLLGMDCLCHMLCCRANKTVQQALLTARSESMPAASQRPFRDCSELLQFAIHRKLDDWMQPAVAVHFITACPVLCFGALLMQR